MNAAARAITRSIVIPCAAAVVAIFERCTQPRGSVMDVSNIGIVLLVGVVIMLVAMVLFVGFGSSA